MKTINGGAMAKKPTHNDPVRGPGKGGLAKPDDAKPDDAKPASGEGSVANLSEWRDRSLGNGTSAEPVSASLIREMGRREKQAVILQFILADYATDEQIDSVFRSVLTFSLDKS